MSESKHTPGPWHIHRIGGIPGSIRGGVVRKYTNGEAQDQLVMVCGVQPDNGGSEAQEANARLIASAPDLAAEVERLRERYRDALQLAEANHRKVEALERRVELRGWECDDGSSFGLSGFAGGAAADGMYSSVMCEYTDPSGHVTVMQYLREDVLSRKVEALREALRNVLERGLGGDAEDAAWDAISPTDKGGA